MRKRIDHHIVKLKKLTTTCAVLGTELGLAVGAVVGDIMTWLILGPVIGLTFAGSIAASWQEVKAE